MGRTIAQLRDETAFWLDDQKQTKFDRNFLDALIRTAYPAVVAVVESAGKMWNLSRTRILIAVTTTAREYTVEATDPQYAAGVIRKPVSVHRVEGVTTTAAVTSALGRTPLTIRPTSEARTLAAYPTWEVAGRAEGVYFYRDSDGIWVLGFEAAEPQAQVVEIAYIKAIKDFLADDEYPTMVPADFQYLIALRAAMMAKGVENRLNEMVVAEYATGQALMLRELNSLRAHVSQRF